MRTFIFLYFLILVKKTLVMLIAHSENVYNTALE